MDSWGSIGNFVVIFANGHTADDQKYLFAIKSKKSANLEGARGTRAAKFYFFTSQGPYCICKLVLFCIYLPITSKNNRPKEKVKYKSVIHFFSFASNLRSKKSQKTSSLKQDPKWFDKIFLSDFHFRVTVKATYRYKISELAKPDMGPIFFLKSLNPNMHYL